MAQAIDIQLRELADRVYQVRRWLVMLIGLRVLAAGILFFLGFLVAFAMADHRWQFGPIMRLMALGTLITGLAALVVFLVRMLWANASVRQAANYIEARRPFDQQLITAIEYHECRNSYPYSQALAERTVANVVERSASVDFLDDIPKWQVYTSAAITAVGLLIIVGSIVAQSAYFVRYFTRLTQPFSPVEALSATRLEAVTGDLIIEPDQNVELAAKVLGQPPDKALLRVIAPTEADPEALFKEVNLIPSDAGDEVRLAAVSSYPKGAYRYRFEAGEATSGWHSLDVMNLPAIAAIYATVTPMPDAEPYNETVQERQLEVLEGAHVDLAVEVSEPLGSVSAIGLDGHVQEVTPAAATRFNFSFDAKEAGEIRFNFTNTKGMHNQSPQQLAVIIRPDELPSFKLISPGGDYLATNVASIPIEMEARDEMGLASADLVIEVPDTPSIRVPAEMGENGAAAVARYLLELEDYPLNLGDTILFYAEATERQGTPSRAAQTVASDVYFIEIRPYRVMHHQLEPSLPHEFSKQGLKGEGHTTLSALLEYTRAILKKSWPLATKPALSVVDDGHVTALQDDLDFAAKQSMLIADNPGVPLDDGQRQSLRTAGADFESAKDLFAARDIAAGLPPIKDAYARVSQLAVALHKASMMGAGGSNQADRDRLKLEEQVHLSRYKKEDVEWELNRLANEVAELEQKQKELQQRFARFLKAYGKQEGTSQKTTDEQSSYEAPMPQNQSSKPGEGGSGGGGDSRTTMDGSLTSPAGAAGSDAPRPDDGRQATTVEQLEVMRALQRTLREQGQKLAQELNEVDKAETAGASDDRAKAREHLTRSFDAMDAFDESIKRALFAERADEHYEQAEQALEDAAFELNLAANMLELDALITQQAEAAKQLRDQAAHMADLARALDQPMDALQRNKLNEQLQNAIVTFQQQGGPQYVSSVGGLDTPPSYIALAQSLVPGASPYDGPNPTNVERAQVARWLAVQFGTMALDAEKQRGALRDSDVSDSSFSPLEQQFFTDAARFKGDGS